MSGSVSFLRSHLALLLVVVFSGCLTIEEHYTFRKNGSGSMTYVVDLSELGALVESFGDGGKGEGATNGAGMMDMTEQVNKLRNLPGIRKVKLNTKKKWVQRISFDFADVPSLNRALNELMRDSSGVEHEFFRWEGSTLVRTNNRHAHELGAAFAKSEEEPQEDTEEGLDMSAMLEAMKYRYSFKFTSAVDLQGVAQGVEVERVSGKEVKLSTDFAVIARDPKAIDLSFSLSR